MSSSLRARSAWIAAAMSAARVRFRRGIISPRYCVSGGGFVSGAGSSAVVTFQAGNNSRLPGWVVKIAPLGAVQITVPSGHC